MELHRASAELRKGRSQFIAISEERNASEDVQTQPGARPGESKMKHTRSTVSTEVQYVSMLKDLSSADSQATPPFYNCCKYRRERIVILSVARQKNKARALMPDDDGYHLGAQERITIDLHCNDKTSYVPQMSHGFGSNQR